MELVHHTYYTFAQIKGAFDVKVYLLIDVID